MQSGSSQTNERMMVFVGRLGLLWGLGGCAHLSDPVPDAFASLPDAPGPQKVSAQAQVSAIQVSVMRVDIEATKAGVAQFVVDWPTSPWRDMVEGWQADLARVGTPAPPVEGLQWVSQPGSLGDHPLTMVIFFEPWCPHCQDEMPALELLRRDYEDRGFGIIGVTAMTRGATDEQLSAFIQDGFLRFPIGKEDGSMTDSWDVEGVPHAFFVRDGTLVWSGNPALLTLDLVDALIDLTPLPLPLLLPPPP